MENSVKWKYKHDVKYPSMFNIFKFSIQGTIKLAGLIDSHYSEFNVEMKHIFGPQETT